VAERRTEARAPARGGGPPHGGSRPRDRDPPLRGLRRRRGADPVDDAVDRRLRRAGGAGRDSLGSGAAPAARPRLHGSRRSRRSAVRRGDLGRARRDLRQGARHCADAARARRRRDCAGDEAPAQAVRAVPGAHPRRRRDGDDRGLGGDRARRLLARAGRPARARHAPAGLAAPAGAGRARARPCGAAPRRFGRPERARRRACRLGRRGGEPRDPGDRGRRALRSRARGPIPGPSRTSTGAPARASSLQHHPRGTTQPTRCRHRRRPFTRRGPSRRGPCNAGSRPEGAPHELPQSGPCRRFGGDGFRQRPRRHRRLARVARGRQAGGGARAARRPADPPGRPC
jgi:hypothetical protein